jgi:hypothetical protein
VIVNYRFFVILAVAAMALNAQSAIPGLCPTGYGAYAGGCGALLSPGSPDGNYTYSYVNPTTSDPVTGSAALLTNLLPVEPGDNPVPWYTSPGSDWISTTDSISPIPFLPSKADSDVIVDYSITFNLTDFNLNAVVISGAWTADDVGLGLILNGVSLAGNPVSEGGALPYSEDYASTPDEPFSYIYSFTLSSSTPGVVFNAGINTLVFSVDQADNYYDGLLVSSLSGTGIDPPPTPEPGSIFLIAAGLGMLALRRRRA